MNPVLVFLIIVAAAILWLICSFLYRPIGRLFNRLFSDAKEAMFEEAKNDNKGED